MSYTDEEVKVIIEVYFGIIDVIGMYRFNDHRYEVEYRYKENGISEKSYWDSDELQTYERLLNEDQRMEVYRRARAPVNLSYFDTVEDTSI